VLAITQKNKNKDRRSNTITQTIKEISEMAERIYVENLHQRINIETEDPSIRQLIVNINAFIERVETAVKKQAVFVSDASHEMRTPISIIKGYADLIDRWGKRDPEILQESINAIKMETEHMNSLINSLLMLAKDEDKHLPYDKDIISLNAVAAEALREIILLHKFDAVELIEESNEFINGDFDMILQLIWIFIENSMKYARNNNDHIIVTIYGNENNSMLSVKDCGIGIGEEDLPNIFERFYRADKSRSTNKIPGFGLGLSVASMIIKAHHASVYVDSQVGEGTEFIVSFPKPKTGL